MRPVRPEPSGAESNEREQLATMLALMLLLLFGGAGLLFLIFVSLGMFLWVLVAAVCIAAYGGLHYLVWGRSIHKPDDRTAGDAEPPAVSDRWPAELLDRTNRTKQGE